VTANKPAARLDYWATFYHPEANYAVTDGITIYKGKIGSGNVELTDATGNGIIPAGQAVVLNYSDANISSPITLTKTTDGSSPISRIVFEDVGTEEGKGSFFEDAAGLELTTDYSDFIGHFMPKDVTKVELTSTYDVYDKQGNLIRQNCTAMNTLDLKKLFFYDSEIKTARRGYRYTVKMTINPTYLYVLSEPDLNNPTVEVE
jgi:hypothetical protein